MIEQLEEVSWERAGRSKGRAFIKESMDLSKHDETPEIVHRAMAYAIDAFAQGADPAVAEKVASTQVELDWEQGLEDAYEEVVEILRERFE